MIVAIIGSTTITDCEHIIEEELKKLKVTKIISGEAPGVDTVAKEYAIKNKIPYKGFPPDKEKYPYSEYRGYAYLKRNYKIVDHADVVLAIWDGKSRGTKSVIQFAKKLKKKLILKIINNACLSPVGS